MIPMNREIPGAVRFDYERLRHECVRLEIPSVGLIALSGEDATSWLQGQVTNDLRRFKSGDRKSFCFCRATGQIQAIVDAWGVGDQILMTCDQAGIPAVLSRVENMVVTEDVSAVDYRETYRLLSVQGPLSSARLSEITTLPESDAGCVVIAGSSIFALRSDRTGSGGWDLWAPWDAAEAWQLLSERFDPVSDEAYNIARIEAGIPMFGTDVTEKTMPPELGPAFESLHVSYRKGCYMGQEVLMRIYSRGHTNRQWVGLVAEGPMTIGSKVSHPTNADAGKVTSVAHSPAFGYIATAMIRGELAADGTLVRILSEGQPMEAKTRTLPMISALQN